ncbi:unnamed protein product [Mucor hiemalis]
MGNSHSHQRRSKYSRRNSFESSSNKLSPTPSQTVVPNAINAITTTTPMITPPLSTKSSPASRANSRPPSVMGDVKTSIQKMLGKSSPALDVVNNFDRRSSSASISKFPPRRSFSVPTDNYFERSVNEVTDGRTYQTMNSKYCLPIDEEEQDRLTNTHYVLKHCFGDNFSAPVHDLLSVSRDFALSSNSSNHNLTQLCSNASVSSIARSDVSPTSPYSSANRTRQSGIPARVLDVACGSGVWVLEMATAFPHSEFYGIDFACLYPNTIKPANTYFNQGDILDPEGFPYPDEYFDYIHMRLVYNCFSILDLKFVLGEIYRVLKPGGYVELRDIDPIIKNPGPTADKFFSDFVMRMSQLHSVDVTWTQNMCEALRQSELTDIHRQEVSVGFGYQGPLATSIDCSIRDSLRSYKKFFMEAYNISSEVCDEQIDHIINESSAHHSFFNYYMAWGRKPLVSEQLINSSGQNTPLLSASVITTADNLIHDTPPLPMTEDAFDIVQFANGFIE